MKVSPIKIDRVTSQETVTVVSTLLVVNESAEVSLCHGQHRVGGDVGGQGPAQERLVVPLLHQLRQQLEDTGEVGLTRQQGQDLSSVPTLEKTFKTFFKNKSVNSEDRLTMVKAN